MTKKQLTTLALVAFKVYKTKLLYLETPLTDADFHELTAHAQECWIASVAAVVEKLESTIAREKDTTPAAKAVVAGPDELLTLEELTARLKVRAGWVYQRIHAGTLPFRVVKIGHYLRFPVSGVQGYIEGQDS